jgi:hypothetical protein
MDASVSDIAKKRPGSPRKTGDVPLTVIAQRRHRDRNAREAEIARIAEQVAVTTAGATAKALTPADMSDEVRDLIETAARDVSKLLAVNSAAVVQATIDRALDGDTAAAALLLKHCISAKTKIRLDAPQGATLEEFADSVIAQTVYGTLAIEDGEAFLRLAEKHSAVTLNGSLVSRLEALTTRLNEAKALGAVQADVTLKKPVIAWEQIVE